MIRRSQLLALGTVGLLSLVGCSSPDQASKPAVVDSAQQASTDAAKDAAGAAKDTAMAPMTGGTNELRSVVTNTKTAVESGDFAQAKEEFGKFEGSWSKVEDGIKTASPDAYTAIETNVDNVKSALDAAQPDKAKVMDALAALDSSITTAKP